LCNKKFQPASQEKPEGFPAKALTKAVKSPPAEKDAIEVNTLKASYPHEE